MLIEPSALLWIASGAPWRWARLRDDGSPAHYIHSRFQRHDRQRYSRLARIGMGCGFVAGVPVVVGLVALCAARNAARVRREGGKGILRQVREQVALWLRQGVLPLSYYIFDLHRGDGPTAALDYLYRYETKHGIYPILRSTFSSAETTDALRNKALFARRCREHGVPAIPALFVVEAGRLTRLDADEPGLPRRDLFLKPLSGSGGRGAAVWTYVGDGQYRNVRAGVKSAAELVAHLVALSQEQGAYVGRLLVRNHPLLEEVSPGALSSVRVVTCLDEAGRPEVTHAVLRMARTPGTVVDNFHAGGIAASVGLDSGVLGRATDTGLSRRSRWWATHPVSGAAILGREVPMWDQVLDAARRAHAAFADQIVVGWDVAVLEDGPALIEGNKGPDLDIVQRTSGQPVGSSRLGTLIAFHLRRALGEEQGVAGAGRLETTAAGMHG
ncbi:MAG: sugar-transfer associated ATP-grasp domain-containing protein [Candidatus Binatia bacterium]